ncbi:MAG: hypothetical protein ACREP7_17685 [Lysobacter sp.]
MSAPFFTQLCARKIISLAQSRASKTIGLTGASTRIDARPANAPRRRSIKNEAQSQAMVRWWFESRQQRPSRTSIAGTRADRGQAHRTREWIVPLPTLR